MSWARLREALQPAAGGAAIGLTLSVAFPDSLGLWPVRLLAGWPGAFGRALGNLFAGGSFGPLALGQSPDLHLLATSASGRALAVGLGLIAQLAVACALLWLTRRPRFSRGLFGALAVAFAIAALLPPFAPVTAAEVSGALACALLAVVATEEPRRLALLFIAGTLGTAPLAELRPVFLGLGRAQGSIAALESASGLAASLFALLASAAFAAAAAYLLLALAPREEATPAPSSASESTPQASEPARVSPP